jgi:hypothetical protein
MIKEFGKLAKQKKEVKKYIVSKREEVPLRLFIFPKI